MSADGESDKLITSTSEEVLRTIFGDDLHGCNVRLETIAAIIKDGLQQRSEEDADLIDMYEKLVEALDLLSTPPDPSKIAGPDELRTLLGERLDSIHALTQKTKKTTESLKALRKGGPQS
ncbi:MAG TPA: hypothetical protein VK615_16055 [Candidatus Binatia bacterium]|nr:hypothetical protein [Candidatus Binatia bacterium]